MALNDILGVYTTPRFYSINFNSKI
jgi:hypothetical protein